MALGMQLSGMKGNLIIINYGSENFFFIFKHFFFLAHNFSEARPRVVKFQITLRKMALLSANERQTIFAK